MSDNENLGSSVDGDIGVGNQSNNAEGEDSCIDGTQETDKYTESICKSIGGKDLKTDVDEETKTDFGESRVMAESDQEGLTEKDTNSAEVEINEEGKGKTEDEEKAQNMETEEIQESNENYRGQDVSENVQDIIEETAQMKLKDESDTNTGNSASVENLNSNNNCETDESTPQETKTEKSVTLADVSIANEKKLKTDVKSNKEKASDKKVEEKVKSVKNDSTKKCDDGKKFEKKDKFTSKKSEDSSSSKDVLSKNQTGKQDFPRNKSDGSLSGRGEAKNCKKDDEKYDQRKKTGDRDDRGKRYEEKDSKRYSDRRDRERSNRDDKPKRFDDKDRRKDDKNGKKGNWDSKAKSVDVKNTKDTPVKSKEMESTKKSTPLPDLKSKQVKSATDLEAQWQKEEDEKRQKEEEEKKKEEELKRKEEELKKKKEEEARKELEEEKKTLDDFIKECKEKQDMKKDLREKNMSLGDNRPDEAFFRKLDSNLKKNTAFVKKLRNLTEGQKESLVKDFEALNLTKYVGEVAAAITEAKLKMSDIPCAVLLCSMMYQRYTDFQPALMENWQKYLLHKKDEKISNPSKYRVDLRFFAELISVGVLKQKEGLTQLASQLGLLMNNDKEEHNNLSIVTSFCKHCGDDYAGLVSRKMRLMAEKHGKTIPKSAMLTPERQKACRNLFGEYYQSLCKHLVKVHKDLKVVERQNRKLLHTKGEISQDRKEHYDALLTGYQKLYTNTSIFADLLDEDLPDLPEEDSKRDEEGGFDIFHPEKDAEFQYVGDTTLFEDEDSRMFYENLPDLKAFIPGICFKDSEQSSAQDEPEEENMDEDDLKIEDVEREMETEQQIAEVESKEEQNGKEEETTDVDLLLQEGEEDDTDTGSLMKMQFDAYLSSLSNCVNRELIDKTFSASHEMVKSGCLIKVAFNSKFQKFFTSETTVLIAVKVCYICVIAGRLYHTC